MLAPRLALNLFKNGEFMKGTLSAKTSYVEVRESQRV